jgi:SAM-dependent methyltransferase
MADESSPATRGAFARVGQPWGDADLAPLYDAFPFADDLQIYLELAAAQGGRVLELGCGTGRVALPLLQAGHRVTGVDVSPAMLAILQRKLQVAGPEVMSRSTLVQADMRDFQLDEQFDLAIVPVKSFAYLLERADQQRALSAAMAHLRPGGLLAIDLLHPSPAWLMEPPGSLRQDLAQYVPAMGATVIRTETAVSTDLAAQLRVIRSAYEVIDAAGRVTKRVVEWPYRYQHRFEAELLLEGAGFQVEAVHGGYRREPFSSDSRLMLFLARRPRDSMPARRGP